MNVENFICLLRRIREKMHLSTIFCDNPRIVRYKKNDYSLDVLRQTAFLVVNLIKGNSFAYFFNCTTIGRASD